MLGHLTCLHVDVNLLSYMNSVVRIIKKRLYIYLLKEMTYLFLLSLVILTFIMVMSRIGRLTDFIINRGVELKDILLLILYSSPPFLTFTLSMAFLLSTIVVFGRLSAENEILALKANGINLKWLILPVGIFGLFITCFGILNTHIFLPRSGELFKDTLINIVKKGISVDEREGVFNDTIPGVVIYIDKIDPKSKTLTGVFVSDERSSEIKQMISAHTGRILLDPATLNLNFLLNDGNLHRWEVKEGVYRNLTFKTYTYSMNLETIVPTGVPLRKRPYEMNWEELKLKASQAKGKEKYEWLLEIYKRFSIPLLSLAFVFLTIPLGIRRRHEGKFSGIAYSLLIFVMYYLLMALTEHIGEVIGLMPLITAFIPDIIVLLIGIYLINGINEEVSQGPLWRLREVWRVAFEKVR